MILGSAQKYRMLISEFIRSSLIEDGYRKITLEEITDNLAISKKTIYKVYPSKNELTRSVMMSELSDAYQNLILLLQEKSTMIQKVEKLSGIIERYIRLFNDASLHNLKKEYPNLWVEIIAFRKEKVVPLINLLLDHSKKHDLIVVYQNELIVKLFNTSLTISTEKRFLARSKLDFRNLFQSIFTVLLTGILTKKGKKLLAINQRTKNENN
jgi:AcrR family transcriptional regulator